MKLPARARIVSFDKFGVGSLELVDTGEQVRFGASACLRFVPAVGVECWLIETRPDPRGTGVRARTINTTGVIEADKRTQMVERQRREHELLTSLGATADTLSYRALANLPDEEQARIADLLMAWKREGHFCEPVFTRLVAVSPESFHPYLAELDESREPEGLAFEGATFEEVEHFAALLAESAEAPQRGQVEIGAVGTAVELNRTAASAQNDVGGAILALARSGEPDAWGALSAWFENATPDAVREAADLLMHAGFAVDSRSNQVFRTHQLAAYEVQPADDVGNFFRRRGTQWGVVADAACEGCGAPLVSVLEIPAAMIPGVLPPEVPDALAIYTCRNCVPVLDTPYYVKLGAPPQSFFPTPLPDNFEPWARHNPLAPPPVKVTVAPAPTAVSYFAADPSELTRVGGAPSWIQGPQLLDCPSCGYMMWFTAQVADPGADAMDLWSSDFGLLYAFLCRHCQLVATLVQH